MLRLRVNDGVFVKLGWLALRSQRQHSIPSFRPNEPEGLCLILPKQPVITG